MKMKKKKKKILKSWVCLGHESASCTNPTWRLGGPLHRIGGTCRALLAHTDNGVKNAFLFLNSLGFLYRQWGKATPRRTSNVLIWQGSTCVLLRSKMKMPERKLFRNAGSQLWRLSDPTRCFLWGPFLTSRRWCKNLTKFWRFDWKRVAGSVFVLLCHEGTIVSTNKGTDAPINHKIYYVCRFIDS